MALITECTLGATHLANILTLNSPNNLGGSTDDRWEYSYDAEAPIFQVTLTTLVNDIRVLHVSIFVSNGHLGI